MITTLSELVAQCESNNNPSAARFEPKFKPSQASVLKCAQYNRPMSIDTATAMCATSWGAYQMMGENLYAFGYKGTICKFWNDPDLQLDYFNLFLKTNNVDFTLGEILNDGVKRTQFAKRYNGSDGRIYGDRLISIYNQINFPKGK